ncbi:hypothetical protein Hdeb2414_s0003g00087961 [Helianthus debilis subsp. tardiflorus]
MAKREFIDLGKRHDNLETIRDTPPTGMGVENWRKTIDLFSDPKYIKRCEVNKKKIVISNSSQTVGGRHHIAAGLLKRMLKLWKRTLMFILYQMGLLPVRWKRRILTY